MGTSLSKDTPIYHTDFPDPSYLNTRISWPKHSDLDFNLDNKSIKNNLDEIIFYIRCPEEYAKLLEPTPNLDQSMKYICENDITLPVFAKEINPKTYTLNIETAMLFMFKYGITHLFNIHIRDWISITQLFSEKGVEQITACKCYQLHNEYSYRGIEPAHQYGVEDGLCYIHPLIFFDKDGTNIIGCYYWNYRPVTTNPAYKENRFVITVCRKPYLFSPPITTQIQQSQRFITYFEKKAREDTIEVIRKIKSKELETPPEVPIPMAPAAPI